ncbi:MAG: 2-amino-4-hydroxy-6-hydroxymethyldihydropteridine diphosphokinase [Gemmatimonadaceae bacterium]|nr:2-amino-4-hydroxy-6-hydroxymethyldihydropteridine diphosphokinase [Gemmatimonadaceae bacterium]
MTIAADYGAVHLRVAIALGSNVGDRHETLASAIAAIAALESVTVLAVTPTDETIAIGPPQAPFLNQMLLLDTDCSLPALLALLQVIEEQHGRTRLQPKGPRTLDLDIVWVRDTIITTRELLVPHPGLLDRDFWHRELAVLLGVEAAREAIASAQVHAGMDTAPHDDAHGVRRPSGTWDASLR